MNAKICSNPICLHNGQPQPLENFYNDTTHKDGYKSRCKDCVTAYWHSDHGRKIKVRAVQKYLKTDKGKIIRKNVDHRRYEINKEKHKARRLISRAVLSGKMNPARDYLCANCGMRAVEYHHHNGYDENHIFDVIPLCRTCHNRATFSV